MKRCVEHLHLDQEQLRGKFVIENDSESKQSEQRRLICIFFSHRDIKSLSIFLSIYLSISLYCSNGDHYLNLLTSIQSNTRLSSDKRTERQREKDEGQFFRARAHTHSVSLPLCLALMRERARARACALILTGILQHGRTVASFRRQWRGRERRRRLDTLLHINRNVDFMFALAKNLVFSRTARTRNSSSINLVLHSLSFPFLSNWR